MDDPFDSQFVPVTPLPVTPLPTRRSPIRPIRRYPRNPLLRPAGKGVHRQPGMSIWAAWRGCCIRTIRSIASVPFWSCGDWQDHFACKASSRSRKC